jgi:hypothetical protein
LNQHAKHAVWFDALGFEYYRIPLRKRHLMAKTEALRPLWVGSITQLAEAHLLVV